jgi:hypothetical protein
MGTIIHEEIARAMVAQDTAKVITSVNRNGESHTIFSDFILLDENGQIRYLELFESSQTNKNLTASIWFDQPVYIVLRRASGESFRITGKVRRAEISGPDFEAEYKRIRGTLGGDYDLSTIWVIEPVSAVDETPDAQLREERAKYPSIGHLDRFSAK